MESYLVQLWTKFLENAKHQKLISLRVWLVLATHIVEGQVPLLINRACCFHPLLSLFNYYLISHFSRVVIIE